MSNEIVTVENTLLIMKWMERTHEAIVAGITIVAKNKLGGFEEYNPITNAEQSREIEEKLLSLGWEIKYFPNLKEYCFCSYFTGDSFESKSLPLAIYKAALWEAKKNEN